MDGVLAKKLQSQRAVLIEDPMLIDEWQTVPKLWDAVRYTVDHRRKMGQFILTGSAVPDKNAEKEMEHPGSFLVKARRETKKTTLSTKSFLIHTNIESPGQRTANINFL